MSENHHKLTAERLEELSSNIGLVNHLDSNDLENFLEIFSGLTWSDCHDASGNVRGLKAFCPSRTTVYQVLVIEQLTGSVFHFDRDELSGYFEITTRITK